MNLTKDLIKMINFIADQGDWSQLIATINQIIGELNAISVYLEVKPKNNTIEVELFNSRDEEIARLYTPYEVGTLRPEIIKWRNSYYIWNSKLAGYKVTRIYHHPS